MSWEEEFWDKNDDSKINKQGFFEFNVSTSSFVTISLLAITHEEEWSADNDDHNDQYRMI